jgi:hypothetical protein
MTSTWTPNHTKLCDTLAQLYLDRTDSERITIQAGINPAFVTFNDNAVNNWFEIIKKADNQGLLVKLIKQALDEFPTNDTLKEALGVSLCDYNSETTPPNNLVLRAEEKDHVSGTEWQGKRANAEYRSRS